MREREITRILAERLKLEGVLNLQVRYGKERGPDIEALLPKSRRQLLIEVKGEVKAPDSAIANALYQILSRYDGQAVCGIALPFTEPYKNLVRNILPGIQRLELHLLFVRDGEIWHLPPSAAGFFPSKPVSLAEVLEQ